MTPPLIDFSGISYDAIDRIKTGLIILNMDKQIVIWNQWMTNYSGLNREFVLNKSLTEIFPELNNFRLMTAIDTALTTRLPAIISNVFNSSPFPLYKHLTNKESLISQTINIIPSTVEDKNYCIIQIEDISASVLREKVLEQQVRERKVIEKQLRNTMDDLQQALGIKNEFLASMSHEIRTPLNGIIGIAQLLASTASSEIQNEYIETILSSGQSLLTIINDILDFSKIEAGKLDLENNVFNLKDLSKQVVKELSYLSDRKNLPLLLNYPADCPDNISGDSTRLKQVLLNLVSNAIKFTESGQVIISIKLITDTASTVTLKVSVTDTGIGISHKDQQRLFDKFTQADFSTTRKYGGTGLGLAICKQLISLMQGDIGVESDSGHGSTFWFQVSFDKAVVQKPKKVIDVASPNSIELKKASYQGLVLLVDDVGVNLLVARKILESFGLEIVLANNGAEALEACKENKFSLIFMDCHMPVMDGFEATSRIRQMESDTHTPIIALTAMAMVNDREKCFSAGMDDYLSKPYQIAEIKQILDKWIVK